MQTLLLPAMARLLSNHPNPSPKKAVAKGGEVFCSFPLWGEAGMGASRRSQWRLR